MPHWPLRTRMDWVLTSLDAVFSQRRLRLNPGPVGREVWTTVEPSAAMRSTARVGPMSPEVASTRIS